MNQDEIMDYANKSKDIQDQLKTYIQSIKTLDKLVENELTNNTKEDTLYNDIYKNSINKLKTRVLEIFNPLLTNLSCKRIMIRENEVKFVGISNSGIGYGSEHGYGDYIIQAKDIRLSYLSKYLPSSGNLNKYIEILSKHGESFANQMCRKDKKEIMLICTQFAKNYNTNVLPMLKSSFNLTKMNSIISMEESRYNRYLSPIKYSYNRVNFQEIPTGITINFYFHSIHLKSINISNYSTLEDNSIYLSLMENDAETKELLIKFKQEIQEKNTIFKGLVEKLHEDLKSYLLLEMLG